MPAAPQTARLSVDRDALDRELGHGRFGAEAAIVAAVELVNVVDELVAFAPGDLDPVVLRRYRLAELQAARDAFVEAAGDLVVGEAPAVAEEEPDA